jgi:hypothetical protein
MATTSKPNMLVAETSPRNRLDRVVRLPPGQFAPGVSANAGGPQRAVRDVAAAREFTDEAVATLAEVMGDTEAPPTPAQSRRTVCSIAGEPRWRSR